MGLCEKTLERFGTLGFTLYLCQQNGLYDDNF